MKLLSHDSGLASGTALGRWFGRALIAGAFLSVAPALVFADEAIHIVIVHSNDIHGQAMPRKQTGKNAGVALGGLPRFAAYVNGVKAEAAKEQEVVFVVDAGDWYQGTPEGFVDDGLSFVDALAQVGYDALCIGNHDFDHGIPNLQRLLKETKLPAVAANLDVKESKKAVEWVPPYRIVERGGVKIAFVGLITPTTPEMTHPDARTLDFLDPSATLTRVEKELDGKVDLIVPLIHIGVSGAKELARAHPAIALIVAGHDHHEVKEGEREGSTLIVETGTKAKYAGRVDMMVDCSRRHAYEVHARLVDLDAEPAEALRNPKVDAQCKKLAAQGEERMKAVVGELLKPAVRGHELTSSTAGNLLTDSLREYTRTDVALMNRGGIRTDLDAGKITRRDVFEMMPFDNNVTVLKMTGAELEGMVKNSIEGKSHSGMEISGMLIEVRSEGREHKLAGLRVGGQPLDAKKVYRVAMNSFMADGGDAYIEPWPAGEKRTDDMTLIRDVLETYFKSKGKVTPSDENRYSVTKP